MAWTGTTLRFYSITVPLLCLLCEVGTDSISMLFALNSYNDVFNTQCSDIIGGATGVLFPVWVFLLAFASWRAQG